MTDPAIILPLGKIRVALIESQGDVFVASQMLGITAMRLDRSIRSSDDLRALVSEIRKIKADPDFDSSEAEQFEKEIQRRLRMYQVVGLDALCDLATMPIDKNSAQNQVKLAAAARLAGSQEVTGGGGEMVETLRALNDLYHKNAPRLRVTRERLTVELSPGEVEIQGESLPSQ